MTMTSYYSVFCKCGHQGKIKLRENDTPYGSSNYENYYLVDLDGGTFSNTQSNADWETVFRHLKPKCPLCNTLLTVENMPLK